MPRNGRIEGFRPENFLHRDLQSRDAEVARYEYNVRRIEYLGNERILYGHIVGQPNGSEYTARMSAHLATPVMREGETYPFTVHPQDLRCFDPASGERIRPSG